MKFTPGPWEALKGLHNTDMPVKNSGWGTVANDDGLCICEVWQDIDMSVEKGKQIAAANAHLIAAAPDLLAALKEVVTISDRKHDAWDRAKAAIAKAEGVK